MGASGFTKINFSATDNTPPEVQARLKGLSRVETTGPEGHVVGARARRLQLPSGTEDPLERSSSEAAGRLFLQTYLEDAGSERLFEVTVPSRPELVPDMQLVETSPAEPLSANSVVFQQTYKGYPIFGGRISVDVDESDNSLVSINGQVAPLPNADPLAELSARQALSALAQWGRADPAGEALRSAAPPVLTWFYAEDADRWHLVYRFTAVAMPPREDELPAADLPFADLPHVCLGHSPRSEAGLYDYFVDAHDGEVVFYFSTTPTIIIPIPMTGQDVAGTVRKFFGMQTPGGFCLSDPLRNLETHDFALQDIDAQPLPSGAIVVHAAQDLGNAFAAAVSAHHNATLVFNFFNDVLKRKSVDNKGMKLVSFVNVWSSRNGQPSPEWKNAVWWQNSMWYGQTSGTSLAKYLDVIAHELTHGVTQTTSNLVYRRLPGALNESFSDIFGVIIGNWYPNQPEPLSNWKWEIGSGLDSGGGPLRDFSNPARTGQPNHFSQYQVLPLSFDQGGVHIYSGIHNKAVHNLLTGTDAAGDPTFPIGEAALLLYLTLTRLTQTSDFADCRLTLESVTRAYHGGDPVTLAVRLQAIHDAYDAVGL